MRFGRLARVLPIVALLTLVIPSPVLADHCGASATVTPASGRPGTTFVFRTNLGASSDLRLYRNDRLVRTVDLDGNGFVRYDIKTDSSDAGRWRARAEVRGQAECAAEAIFTVAGAPDTSTAPLRASPSSAAGLIVFIAGFFAFGIATPVGSTIRLIFRDCR